MSTLRFLVVLAATMFIAAPRPAEAQAQDWPNKPVRILVPYAAGGSADGQARIVALRFSEAFGQQFVVENRTGAGGAIAVEAAVRSPADGYTLLWGVQPQIVILPAINKVSYDAVKDLAPVSVLGTNPFVLVVNGKLPVKSVAEFVSYAKAQDKPISYGTSGIGSIAHLAMALFAQRAGLQMTAVHYRGNAPALSDVIAGHVPAMFATLADALPHAAGSEIRLLGVTGEKRASQLPQVPAIAESGYPGYNVITWNGVMAPAGTPQPIIDKMAAELARAAKDPKFAAKVTAFGVDPVGNSPAEFAKLIAREIPQWKEAVAIAGVKTP
jgi:tripartite-type tricarboxylate transporter receptor subunit TctC